MPKFLSLIGPPILLSLALPLAFLATVTTTLAFGALLFRASIVYFELGVAVTQSWLLPNATSKSPLDRGKSSDVNTPAASAANGRRRSKGSGSGTPGTRTPRRTESFGTVFGPSRDFEGVGGWRFADDARDDETWIGINSRLELPAASGPSVPPHRRHRRTLSSQSQVFENTSETFRMSPMTSRARTPQAYDIGQGPTEYFSATHSQGTGGDLIPMSPAESIAKHRMDERRRSVSAASNASSGSSGQHAATFTTT